MIYDGWVYLAKSDTGHYKIGRSKNPFSRIKHFDTIMPVGIKIVAMVPSDDYVELERRWHMVFDKYRVTGEWFDLPEDIVENIKRVVAYLDDGVIQYMGDRLIDFTGKAKEPDQETIDLVVDEVLRLYHQ